MAPAALVTLNKTEDFSPSPAPYVALQYLVDLFAQATPLIISLSVRADLVLALVGCKRDHRLAANRATLPEILFRVFATGLLHVAKSSGSSTLSPQPAISCQRVAFEPFVVILGDNPGAGIPAGMLYPGHSLRNRPI